jgi:hypothetical protein
MTYDINILYASLVEVDTERALATLMQARRRAMRIGATASAAKCFRLILGLATKATGVRMARRFSTECPDARSFLGLGFALRKAGALPEARRAFRRMLREAMRRGDLDGAATARHCIADPAGAQSVPKKQSFHRRISEAVQVARSDPRAAYSRLRRLRQAALREGGRWTASDCLRGLIFSACLAEDARACVRFARELTKEERTSWAHLALAFAEEHNREPDRAKISYARAHRLASIEGDIHRMEAAAAGLRRLTSPRTKRFPRQVLERLAPLLELRRVVGI